MKTIHWLALAATALLVAGGQAAHAQARSIEDCEKIEAWDAYNKCLAAFGRKQGTLRVTPDAGPSEAAPRARRGRGVRSAGVVTRRNGRAFAVFDVSAPVKQSPRRRGR